MKTSTFNSALTTLLVVVLISTFFQNTTFGQSFPSDVDRNGLVFDGEVSSLKGVWSADKRTIYTINWFKPSSIYAGDAEMRDSIPVLVQGGLTEEGLLVVSHSQRLYSGYSYLMALEPCHGCVEGMDAWRIIGSIGEFRQKEYQAEKSRWANRPRVRSTDSESSCEGSEEVLYISFGNIHLSPGLDSIEGYIDIKTRTTEAAKLLYSLSSNLQYSSSLFGSYAVVSNKIEAEPIGSLMQQAYNSATSDVASNKASFSMTKNTSSTDAYSIETYYTPVARINFKMPASSIDSLSNEIDAVFGIEAIDASYMCDGRTYSFRNIIIEDREIGVDIEGKLEAGIKYEFGDIKYKSSDNTFSFNVLASSSEETYLDVANIKISFSGSAFLPFQAFNAIWW